MLTFGLRGADGSMHISYSNDAFRKIFCRAIIVMHANLALQPDIAPEGSSAQLQTRLWFGIFVVDMCIGADNAVNAMTRLIRYINK